MAEPRLAVVTGGSGFIGRFLIEDLLASGSFDQVINFDLIPRTYDDRRVSFRQVDVRAPIRETLEAFDAAGSWLFNLAALAREPGWARHEYFDTNVRGAETVTAWAASQGIRNLFFTSSMSALGRMEAPTGEDGFPYPETAYGVSKLVAEKIHEAWLAADSRRRLIVCRPAVIFGPGDRENVARIVAAVRRGYFAFPADPSIVKAYGYIYGLLESVRFVLGRSEPMITYHYAERDCVSLRQMVRIIGEFFGRPARIVRLPQAPLVGVAHLITLANQRLGRTSPIHPVRVRKVAFPTNLRPQYLIDHGFEFRYALPTALEHWRARDPELFG